jgi:alkanesulfonate monooxygenase SsuD/methylene tetrahydromethanopterin reductase-like flavin-dependent oxidoreductase (luciferase family)
LRDVQLAHPPDVVPPVLAGVRGPKSLALAGRVADGTILAEPTTPEYLSYVKDRLGRTAPGHQLVAYNIAAVDDSPTIARDLARRSLVWIGEPEWASHIDPLPFADEFRWRRERAASRQDFAATLPDEWVDRLAIVGTAAQARARVDMLAAAGVDHVILIPAGDRPEAAALEALARVL